MHIITPAYTQLLISVPKHIARVSMMKEMWATVNENKHADTKISTVSLPLSPRACLAMRE